MKGTIRGGRGEEEGEVCIRAEGEGRYCPVRDG